MPVENNIGDGLYVLASLIGLLVLTGMLYNLASYFSGFSRELRYLNMEIKRTQGRERKYYIRQRRRLWLSLIPFVKYRSK